MDSYFITQSLRKEIAMKRIALYISLLMVFGCLSGCATNPVSVACGFSPDSWFFCPDKKEREAAYQKLQESYKELCLKLEEKRFTPHNYLDLKFEREVYVQAKNEQDSLYEVGKTYKVWVSPYYKNRGEIYATIPSPCNK
jgi:hypothetical protein